MKKKRWLFVAVFRLLASGSLQAVTINVTSTADILADDGVCTLREAVLAANDNFPSGFTPGECPPGLGADKIVLTVPGTYKLMLAGLDSSGHQGDLDIDEDLEIEGGDPATFIIDASSLDRVFEVHGNTTTVVLRKLTITGGDTDGDGGGVTSFGKLTIVDSVIADNRAETGGGVNSRGELLELTRTTFQNNVAVIWGGGFYFWGNFLDSDYVLSVDTCIFDSNSASQGGGFKQDQAQNISIVDSIFHNNSADSGGGAIRLDPLHLCHPFLESFGEWPRLEGPSKQSTPGEKRSAGLEAVNDRAIWLVPSLLTRF